MTINFRQPKYILPLIALPFLCLFFYVYHANAGKTKKMAKQQDGLNATIADVSPEIKKRRLEDKLDAYRDRYKDADANTAVTAIPSENDPPARIQVTQAIQQKRRLDSIDSVMKKRFNPKMLRQPSQDQQLAQALNNLKRPPPRREVSAQVKQQDPMELFRKQMTYIDSVRKISDPVYQKQQQEAKLKAEAKKADDKTLAVTKTGLSASDFNTVRPQAEQAFITAMIDENITGYAGSRIRLRLLEPIMAGKVSIPKDTYLYALVNGFSGQRVTLQIESILFGGQLLPVKLEVYDQDGLPGLYVPDSQFRDFTKDLGTGTIQGVSIDNGSASGSQFLVSTAGKIFQSASGAIASAIRKNKAKIKYNSYVYLIDTKNSNLQ